MANTQFSNRFEFCQAVNIYKIHHNFTFFCRRKRFLVRLDTITQTGPASITTNAIQQQQQQPQHPQQQQLQQLVQQQHRALLRHRFLVSAKSVQNFLTKPVSNTADHMAGSFLTLEQLLTRRFFQQSTRTFGSDRERKTVFTNIPTI